MNSQKTLEINEVNELFALAELSQSRLMNFQKELRNRNLIIKVIVPFLSFISLCIFMICLEIFKPGIIMVLLMFFLFNFPLFCQVHYTNQNYLNLKKEVKQETKIFQRILTELQGSLPYYILNSTPNQKAIYQIRLKRLNGFSELKILDN